MSRRHAGVVLPLSAAPSSGSWGIGELPDLEHVARWLASAGFDRLMLLPLGPVSNGTTSPYSTASMMAIAPWYLAVEQVEDFRKAGGRSALTPASRRLLEAAKQSPRIDYGAVEHVKREALELAFDRFELDEWDAGTARGAAFAAYTDDQRWWLDDFAFFQALKEERPETGWRAWPKPLRDRGTAALDRVRVRLSRELRRQRYWQWLAEGQWQEARRRARVAGVQIFGDLPFAADVQSADVWVRASEHRVSASIGAPPDAFNKKGQSWGLPPYRWDRVEASDYEVVRQRARRMAALYDGFRIDHLVGWYRMYVRPRSGKAFFSPAGRAAQRLQGERVVEILRASGAVVLAEDLGRVPAFVRASLEALGVPGCKVLRWERDRKARGRPFIDPAEFPPRSNTMTGTHDTDTLAGWWEHASARVRAAVLGLPGMRGRGLTPADPWNDAVRDALLELAWGSGSDDLFVMMQDIFGWRDRINTPGTVGDCNWTWRLPWPVDRMGRSPAVRARARACRRMSEAADRGDGALFHR
jgi:4-alpha-glucanotransferase